VKFIELFPRVVSVSKLKDLSSFDKLRNLDLKDNVGNKSGKNSYILNNPEYSELKDTIEVILNEHFYKVYNPIENIELYVTQSWVNHTEKDEYHHRHSHPNSILSGVLYLDIDKDSDNITFFSGQNNHDTLLKFTPEEYNLYNSTSWTVNEFNEGNIIIFPSILEHAVETRKDSGITRISLAFNSFVKGKIGVYNDYTELQL
jgi:uncharacterized protein (TIGR02466 family)